MAKMKWGSDIDWKGLNDEEYSEGEFEDYEGPVPPKGTLLRGEITKAWLAESQSSDNTMFKVLFVADGNEGDKEEYNGCPIWDNVVFTSPGAKFHWQPFFDALGITLKDVKLKTIVGEEDNVGTVVDSIGSVKFPVPTMVKTDVQKKGEYKGQARVGKWLPPVESDVEEDEMDDEESF